MILVFIAAFLIGFSKALSDRVADTVLWEKSCFRNYNPKGFFGPKDQTWIRKHYYKGKNRFLYWLFKNPLVMFTDIWHLGNTIRISSTWLLVVGFIEISWMWNLFLYAILICCIWFYMCGFSLFYKIIFYRKLEEK